MRNSSWVVLAGLTAQGTGDVRDPRPAATTPQRAPVEDRVEKDRNELPNADDASRLSSLQSIMAEPVRLRLLLRPRPHRGARRRRPRLALDAPEDKATYGLRLLRTAGLVTSRKQGRTVLYRLAEDSPEALRGHCLRRFIELTRHATEND